MQRTLTALFTLAMLGGLLASPVSAAPSLPEDTGAQAPMGALSTGQVQLQLITSGLSSPIGVVNAGDGTGRLFVVQQGGTVRIVSGNRLQSGIFLDIRGVSGGLMTGGEQGLLGLAFHPNFETNRRLYVNYTDGGGDTVIAEFTANASRTSVSLGTRDVLTTIDQPYANHNGGQLLFGPDGFLYVFMGDGGSSGDPQNRAQNDGTPLGKVLRMNPDSGAYTHWAKGLRNPWRASFDMGAATPQLWIADVGQGSREEINRVAATTAGVNYGWRCREGTQPFTSCGSSGPFQGPVVDYTHSGGNCSVTGGHVYRGSVFRDFVGQYVLGDYCSGRLWTLAAGAGSPSLQFHRDTAALISSFGESESGEIYMTDHAGRLYRVVAPPFNDVASSIHINSITWLFYEGITGGCGPGQFCPKASVTRAEMASFLVRALNLPASGRDFFTDDNSSIHENDINALAAAGITGGCSAARFCPSSRVTRQEMASFLVRALDLPATGTDFFTDDNSSIHEGDINRLAASGITGGCSATTFCPHQSVTREQMAAFLERALN